MKTTTLLLLLLLGGCATTTRPTERTHCYPAYNSGLVTCDTYRATDGSRETTHRR